jgi:hypothetical protein
VASVIADLVPLHRKKVGGGGDREKSLTPAKNEIWLSSPQPVIIDYDIMVCLFWDSYRMLWEQTEELY